VIETNELPTAEGLRQRGVRGTLAMQWFTSGPHEYGGGHAGPFDWHRLERLPSLEHHLADGDDDAAEA